MKPWMKKRFSWKTFKWNVLPLLKYFSLPPTPFFPSTYQRWKDPKEQTTEIYLWVTATRKDCCNPSSQVTVTASIATPTSPLLCFLKRTEKPLIQRISYWEKRSVCLCHYSHPTSAVEPNDHVLLMNTIITPAASALDSKSYWSCLYKQLTRDSSSLLFMATLMISGFFQSPLNRVVQFSLVINLNKSTGADNLEPKWFSLAARSNISSIFHLYNLDLAANEPLLIQHPEISWLHTLERVTAGYDDVNLNAATPDFTSTWIFCFPKWKCHVVLWEVLSAQYGFRTNPPIYVVF